MGLELGKAYVRPEWNASEICKQEIARAAHNA
jgi:hypothetical protein